MSTTTSTATSAGGRMPPVLLRAREVLAAVLAWTAAALLIAMTLLVLYQVFTRYVLGAPADFTEELVRYCLIWTGFVAAAYAFATRRHMALVVVRDILPTAGRRALVVAVDLLVLVFALAVITIGGALLAYAARHETSALLGIPRSIVYGVAPIAGALIVLVQLVNVWEDVVDPDAALAGSEDGDTTGGTA